MTPKEQIRVLKGADGSLVTKRNMITEMLNFQLKSVFDAENLIHYQSSIKEPKELFN